jgi:hypothetical protein
MKRILAVIALCLGALILVSLFTAYLYSRKPGVRFLLCISGVRSPRDFTRHEITIKAGSAEIPVMVYNPAQLESDTYWILQHGITPQAHKHPRMDQLASSLCHAAGVNVLIPYIRGSVEGRDLIEAVREIGTIYAALAAAFPGRYRAMGACIGANGLLLALNDVASDIYPEKMLLVGPFFDGAELVKSYNEAGLGMDIIGKMVLTMNAKVFSDNEREAIRRAISVSKPGMTDVGEMRKVLGEKLFNDLLILDIHHGEFESVNGPAMFRKNKKLPHCKYYILHSKTDNIVPFYQGESLYKYIKGLGGDSSFLGTEILSHSENTITVTGLVKEITHMVNFLDDLFANDALN